jgi:ribonuclease HI
MSICLNLHRKASKDCIWVDNSMGAAAVLYKQGRHTKALRYCLGLLTDHTPYEREAVGVALALEILSRERGVKRASVLLDNQAVIQSISYVKPQPAQWILHHAHGLANRVVALARPQRASLKII